MPKVWLFALQGEANNRLTRAIEKTLMELYHGGDELTPAANENTEQANVDWFSEYIDRLEQERQQLMNINHFLIIEYRTILGNKAFLMCPHSDGQLTTRMFPGWLQLQNLYPSCRSCFSLDQEFCFLQSSALFGICFSTLIPKNHMKVNRNTLDTEW